MQQIDHAAAAEAAKRQRKQIDDARLLLKPGKVELHKTPGWLVKRLRAFRRAKGRVRDHMPSGMLLSYTLADYFGGGSGGGWLDHWGSSKVGPSACCHRGVNLVSEPYGFHSDTAHALDTFCAALGGLRWHVSSNTWWYPGQTVRITIHERAADD